MADATDCWEYFTALFGADAGKEKEYIRKRYPQYKADKYDPTALEPALNGWGKLRWELVSLHPYACQNGDVMLHSTGNYHYSHLYLAVFKRRLLQPAP